MPNTVLQAFYTTHILNSTERQITKHRVLVNNTVFLPILHYYKFEYINSKGIRLILFTFNSQFAFRPLNRSDA